jgi:hypothetical protein
MLTILSLAGNKYMTFHVAPTIGKEYQAKRGLVWLKSPKRKSAKKKTQ